MYNLKHAHGGDGDWGLANPQSPIPNPQLYIIHILICTYYIIFLNKN